MVKNDSSLSFRDFLPTALILALTGWAGLLIVIYTSLPTLGPRWLFFFFGIIAITGITMPVILYLHKRFPSKPVVEKVVILRESLFLGILAAAIAWLKIGNVLNTNLGWIIAGAFLVIELLLRLWESSRWKPK